MFCIEIIVILILILFLFRHSLCPRIIVIPVCSILGKRECLERTDIRIRIAIISIQTFSLSQNNSNPCSSILGQRECFV